MEKIHLHVLNASGAFDNYQKLLQNIFDKSIVNIQKLIPINKVDVVMYDNPEATQGFALTGYTPTPHVIFISLDPSIKDFTHQIESVLERCLAHELHHALRWRKPGYGTTLLEALVTEGLADHFANEIEQPVTPDPWTNALSEEQMKQFSSLAQKNYHKTYDHNEWFFGSKKIPYWTGYTLGYTLVEKYLQKHPEAKASMLYDQPAELFI